MNVIRIHHVYLPMQQANQTIFSEKHNMNKHLINVEF